MFCFIKAGDTLYGWKKPKLEEATGLDQLPELGYCEVVSRLFIDIILIPIAKILQMHLQLEETVKCLDKPYFLKEKICVKCISALCSKKDNCIF